MAWSFLFSDGVLISLCYSGLEEDRIVKDVAPNSRPSGGRRLRVTLLGVGAMRSPRFAPAGLLVEAGRSRVMLDGGPGAVAAGALDAWLVTDAYGELVGAIRRLARARGLEPGVASFATGSLGVTPRPVVHTSHAAWGYLIKAGSWRVAWVPEFWRFPAWVVGADLCFADAAGWARPIRFANGVGGHACVFETADAARRRRVGRLVFAHIGRPSIRAMDAGKQPPFGEWGEEGTRFVLGERLRRYRARRT